MLPMAITPVAATFTFRIIFNPTLGILNYSLRSVGLPPQAWLADPGLALPTLILVDSWQWTPFILLIVAGGLTVLPIEPFEAAWVDGADRWQTFRFLTLPMPRPCLAVAILFRSMDAFKTFDIIFVLTGGGPGITTRSINLLAYKQGIEFLSIGKASTIAIVMLVVVIVFTQVFLRRSSLLAHVARNLAIIVWVLKGFFGDLPKEIEEAALIDGCSHWRVFRLITLPLTLPGIATTGIISFLFALVLTDNRVRAVPTGLYSFVGYQQILWGELSASAILMLAPVFLMVALFQRQLVRGLTMGAVK